MASYHVLETNGKLGAVFKNLCFNEFYKILSTTTPQPTIYFWRTAGGADVDFVIESGNPLIPVEIKFNNTYGGFDLKNLLKFKQDHPKKVNKMILVYNGPLKIDAEFIFLPLWLI